MFRSRAVSHSRRQHADPVVLTGMVDPSAASRIASNSCQDSRSNSLERRQVIESVTQKFQRRCDKQGRTDLHDVSDDDKPLPLSSKERNCKDCQPIDDSDDDKPLPIRQHKRQNEGMHEAEKKPVPRQTIRRCDTRETHDPGVIESALASPTFSKSVDKGSKKSSHGSSVTRTDSSALGQRRKELSKAPSTTVSQCRLDRRNTSAANKATLNDGGATIVRGAPTHDTTQVSSHPALSAIF
jgi:hypothetical protein